MKPGLETTARLIGLKLLYDYVILLLKMPYSSFYFIFLFFIFFHIAHFNKIVKLLQHCI